MLRVVDLAHSYPGTGPLFDGLNFTLHPGEVVAIVGPSGSGKSTLLHLMAGWETPRSGTVTRSGIDRIGWVFQNPHGVARRSAIDHVTLPLLAQGLHRKEAEILALDILDRFALSDVAERDFRHLSGGEAQRLMLARATALAPDLLLVDEPTAQLDPRTAETVNDVLAQIAHDDSIVVVATHDPYTRDACHRVFDLGSIPPPDPRREDANPGPESPLPDASPPPAARCSPNGEQ